MITCTRWFMLSWDENHVMLGLGYLTIGWEFGDIPRFGWGYPR